MATNAFNTGKDLSIVVIHPLARGGRLDLPLVTDFEVKPTHHDIKRSHIDGFSRTQHIPECVQLSWSVDRSDPAVDAFCSALWSGYRLAGRVPDGMVYAYVNEIDGSQTSHQFDGVAFKADSLGTFKKEDAVPQKLMGTAMDFRKL